MSAVLDIPAVAESDIALHKHSKPRVSIADADGWRVIRSCDPDHVGSWRQLLAANSTMPPRLKFALAPDTWNVELRAECLPGEETLCHGCEAYFRGEFIALAHDDDADPPPVDAESWIQLCESAGWKAEARANKTVVVPLPSGRHIRIDTSEGAVRGVVELGGIGEGEPAEARELLLLTLAHEVRMMRPLLRGRASGDHTLAEIETGFRRMPGPEEWHHALASLAVATAACAEVFDAFADEDLAREYLAIRLPR